MLPGDDVRDGLAGGTERVDRMIEVGVPERDTEKDASTLGDPEIVVQEWPVRRKCRLWGGGDAKALCSHQESAGVQAAVDGTIDTKVRFGGNQRNVRGVEELEIAERLGQGSRVPFTDAHTVVKLKTACAATIAVDPCVFRREREIRLSFSTGLDVGKEFRAEAIGARAFGDNHLPRLSITPGRGPLGELEQAFDDGARDLIRMKLAARPASCSVSTLQIGSTPYSLLYRLM